MHLDLISAAAAKIGVKMSAISTRPITIKEFDKLVLPRNRDWELHNGAIVEVCFPNWTQKRLQHRLTDLLQLAFPASDALAEMPFQVEATNDKRLADLGVTTKECSRQALQTGILAGAPELVAEVLSLSNTVQELKRYRRLCFEHGTKIFLTLDPHDSTVEVHLEANNTDCVLKPGDMLRLSLFGTEAEIPVTAIFTGITLPENDSR
jgi:Uma2 family endonuclease